MTGELKLREAFFLRLRRASLWVIGLLALFAGGTGLLVGWRQGASPGVLLTMAPVLLGLVAFGGWRGMRLQAERYRSYTLVVGENALERRMDGFPPLRLALAEITRGVRIPGRGLTLYGPGSRPALHLPADLEDFEDLATWLERGRTFEERPARGGRAALVLLAIVLPLVGLPVTLVANSRPVILGFGLPTIAFLVAALVLSLNSSELDRRTRRQMWLCALPLVVLLLKVWSALRP